MNRRICPLSNSSTSPYNKESTSTCRNAEHWYIVHVPPMRLARIVDFPAPSSPSSSRVMSLQGRQCISHVTNDGPPLSLPIGSSTPQAPSSSPDCTAQTISHSPTNQCFDLAKKISQRRFLITCKQQIARTIQGKGKKQLCSMRALPAWRLWACTTGCHGNNLWPCNTQTEKENRLRLESRSEKKTMQKRRVRLKKKKRREKTGIARVPLYQEWGSNPCVHTHIGT